MSNKRILLFILFLSPLAALAQGLSLKVGDTFPAVPINNIINAPVKSIDLAAQGDKKLYVLNFWGTWCSPCIPEMDALAILQKNNATKLQIIAISDDEPKKLQNYLKNKPTTAWLATDTNYLFYKLFNFSSVSHSAIVDADKRIVALMKTHSVTQSLIDTLLSGGKVRSDAILNEAPVSTSGDLFGVDTTITNSFTVRGYMRGQQTMSRSYGVESPYAGRRISFVNMGLTSIYKDAYQIVSQKQVVYEVDEKKINDYENNKSKYNIDLVVDDSEKDSLLIILQQRLNALLPVKARIEYQNIPVYVLTNDHFSLTPSAKPSTYGFSGSGYDGTAVTVAEFADSYLSNELELPVVDETNLAERYNIKTVIEMRTRENIIQSIRALGLKIEKQERKMKMLVLYQ